jgi:hypothetical protein
MAGAGYKLFNTGDVLTAAQVNTYLMEQTTMVFASAAARTTALSGVLAEGMMSYLQDTNSVEVYNGSSWVAVGNTGDITGITTGATSGLTGGVTSGTADLKLNTTAKGGLLVGTGSGTVTELTVGANNTVLTADSSTASGLKWATAGAESYIGAAAYRQGTNINYTQNVETLITYSDEEFDSSGFWEGVTNPGRLTIPAGLGGKYLINFQWRTATGLNNCGVFIYKNGSRLLLGRESGYLILDPDLNANGPAINASTVVDAAATDYFTIQVQQSAASGNQTTWSRFSIMRLGV